MKIATLRQFHNAMFPNLRFRPTAESIGAAHKLAQARGHHVGPSGRFYVPTETLNEHGHRVVTAKTPAGMRWQNGRLIPRHAHR